MSTRSALICRTLNGPSWRFLPFSATRALPSSVFGPVENRHGWWSRADCRSRALIELHEFVRHRHIGHPVARQPLLSERGHGRGLIHCLTQPGAVSVQLAGQQPEEELEPGRQIHGGDGRRRLKEACRAIMPRAYATCSL